MAYMECLGKGRILAVGRSRLHPSGVSTAEHIGIRSSSPRTFRVYWIFKKVHVMIQKCNEQGLKSNRTSIGYRALTKTQTLV